MKKCTYCGKQYPDDAAACAVDADPLETIEPPKTLPPPLQPVANKSTLNTMSEYLGHQFINGKCNYCGASEKAIREFKAGCQRSPHSLPASASSPLRPVPPPKAKEKRAVNPFVIALICGVVGGLLFSPANFGVHQLNDYTTVVDYDKNGNPEASFNIRERLPLVLGCGAFGLVISFVLNLLRKASKK